MADGTAEIEAVAALLERCGAPALEEGTRVLDAPCGPGRHVVPLAERGCLVTGVDLHAESVARAAASLEARGLAATLTQADMYELTLPAESVDVALNLFTSIGYGTLEDDARYVAAVFEALRPGGALVIDVFGKEIAARDYRPSWYAEVDGYVVHVRMRPVAEWSRWELALTLRREGVAEDARMDHVLYGASDLRRLLRDAGFRVQIFGSLDGIPYDSEAKRLVAVARKETR